MRISDPVHALDFGALTLVTPDGEGPYSLHAMEDGTNWGNPSPVFTVIESLLGDGSLVSYDRDDNREVPIGVKVSATDGVALAEAEAALVAETRRQNVLSWTPPDGWGPTTVFDVITSSLEHVFSGQDELNLERRYILHLVCYPSTKSASETVTTAIVAPVSPSTVTIDDCSVATGWTSTVDGVADVVDDGGAELYVEAVIAAGNGHVFTIKRTAAAVDMSSTSYLVIDWKATTQPVIALYAHADGINLPKLAEGPSPVAGFTRSMYLCTDSSVTMFEMIAAIGRVPTGGTTERFTITNLIRTNVGPSIGTARQLFRSLEVGGSARTIGSLVVQHETDALGSVLIYTCPDDTSGYQPPLRPWLVTGTPTTDSGIVSGAYNDLSVGVEYQVPAGRVPGGTYAVLARIRHMSGSNLDVDWTFDTLLGSNTLLGESGTTTVDVPLADGEYHVVQLATVTLPVHDHPLGTSALLRVIVDSIAVFRLDEVWLFNLTTGALTWVECGDGTPAAGGDSNRLWIDTASLERPRPSVWVGTAADRSDSRAPTDRDAWSTHRFEPGNGNVFTVTSKAEDAEVSLRHYLRWHTHAAS